MHASSFFISGGFEWEAKHWILPEVDGLTRNIPETITFELKNTNAASVHESDVNILVDGCQVPIRKISNVIYYNLEPEVSQKISKSDIHERTNTQ